MNCITCNEPLTRCHWNRKYCDECNRQRKNKKAREAYSYVPKFRMPKKETCEKIMEWAEK